MLHRIYKHFAAITGFLAMAGCAGGSSCAGVTPLEDGFKIASRVENAGALRLTSSGLDFLEKDIGALVASVFGLDASGGVLTIGIPTLVQQSLTVCPGGPNMNASPPRCVTEIDLGAADLKIDPLAPSTLQVSGTLPFRVQDLPLKLTPGGPATLTLNGNGACPPAAQTYAPIGGTISLSIELDTSGPKLGYSRGRLAALSVDKQALKDALNFCDAPGATVEDALVDELHQQILDALKGALDQQLCRRAEPTADLPCPKGTTNVAGICRYGTAEDDVCYPALLGGSGHMNLGGALASLSPGTKSELDFLFALGGAGVRDDASGMHWGDLNPIQGGATLGLYGGLEASPAASCAPLSKLELPSGIPIPDELLASSLPDWPTGTDGPHVGISLSERFVNYALSRAYNSGLFCIAISTSTVDLLSSGTLGLVASSLKDLGLQQETQQVALIVRPTAPPHVEIGGGTNIDSDPLLRVTMEQVSLDMYIWSLDRFIRFLTVTLDLDVPLNLVVTPDGLQPVLNTIGAKNAVVTSSQLLREDPAKLAVSLEDVIGGFVGQAVGGSIGPVNINELLLSGLGLSIAIPESEDGEGSPGLRKLSKGSNDYLGIFGSLGFVMKPPAPGAPQAPVSPEPSVRLIRKDIDPAGVRLSTMTPENGPVARLEVDSADDSKGRPIEHAYRVDQGLWHPFRRDRVFDVKDAWLKLQGRHTIEVRSRFVGEPMSLSTTAASVEVLVDVDPPSISIGQAEGDELSIAVRDFVSDGGRALVRTRLDQGVWTAFRPALSSEIVNVAGASEIEVEAHDEEGNMASAAQAIIRGGAPPSVGGCGCITIGGEPQASSWPALLTAAAGAMALRSGRRRRGAR